jgi:hypothetical protein
VTAFSREAEDGDIDRDALLCALVLSPRTFPRNRFFRLFSLPWARSTRFRAAQIRSILRHLSHRRAEETRAQADGADERGTIVVRYVVPDLGLQRTAILERLELAALRFALARGGSTLADPTMLVTDEDRRLVEEALAKLGRRLELGSASHAPPPDNGGS